MDSTSLIGHEIPRVPFPPDTGAMDFTFQLIFNAVVWAVAIGFVYWAYRSYRKSGSILPFLFLVGGGFCMFIEPIVDVMGLVWFHREGQWVLFEVFGRPIPTFMLPTYIFFVGGQALYTYTRLNRGETMTGIWKLYGIYFIVNILLEEPPLHMGLYTYYGAQPFQPVLLPLWWPMINAAMPIVIAAIVYRLKPHLTGWKIWAVVPLMPMGDALANAAIAWPIWTAVNSSSSLLVTHSAALISVALAVLLVQVLAVTVATDSPVGKPCTGRTDHERQNA